MLNAEDTKERIRKLRLKVVSGPTDPMIEDSFNENTVESTKIISEWKDATGSENFAQKCPSKIVNYLQMPKRWELRHPKFGFYVKF